MRIEKIIDYIQPKCAKNCDACMLHSDNDEYSCLLDALYDLTPEEVEPEEEKESCLVCGDKIHESDPKELYHKNEDGTVEIGYMHDACYNELKAGGA